MNDLDPTDPLWDLLDHSSRVEPSPYFSRRVVREVKALSEGPRVRLGGFRSLFASPTRAASALVFGCALLALVIVSFPRGTTQSPASLSLSAEDNIEAFDPASEMAAVEYLGQLMAIVDPGQLDDDALADLFF